LEIPKIQWYPGHIAKAEKKLTEVINRVDLVIEVRDASILISINGLETKNISL
jgi:ribosome biogenesis GTPase A